MIGCTKISPGCANCYAAADNARRKWNGGTWGPGAPRKRTSVAYWRNPLKWNADALAAGERRRVFCASLADVFDHEWPAGVLDDLWALIRATPDLDWLLLTKRADRIALSLPTDWGANGYPNVWLGVTVENQAAADERIPYLLRVGAVVRFLSLEPLLGPVVLPASYLPEIGHNVECTVCRLIKAPRGRSVAMAMSGSRCDHECPGYAQPPLVGDLWAGDRSTFGFPRELAARPTIDWLIVGGESGSRARHFNIDWERALVEQGRQSGAAVFVKQMGHRPGTMVLTGELLDWTPLQLAHQKGSKPEEWPADLVVRQFPTPRSP